MNEKGRIWSLEPILGALLWSHLLTTQTPKSVLECIANNQTETALYKTIEQIAALPDAYEAQWLLKTGGKAPETPPLDNLTCSINLYWRGIESEGKDANDVLRCMITSGAKHFFRAVEYCVFMDKRGMSDVQQMIIRTIWFAVFHPQEDSRYKICEMALMGSKTAILAMTTEGQGNDGKISDACAFWTVALAIVSPGAVKQVRGANGTCSAASFFALGQAVLRLRDFAFLTKTLEHVEHLFQPSRENSAFSLFVLHGNWVVKFYLQNLKQIKGALDAAAIALTRLGMVQDVRMIIARLLWKDRHVWIK